MPVAVYVSRVSTSVRLLQAGYAIPVGILLGLLAIALARRARREASLALGRTGSSDGIAVAGRLLGLAGICIAAAALVSLGVYELLQYQGRRG
jgi:hypothetical protein